MKATKVKISIKINLALEVQWCKNNCNVLANVV